MKATRARIDPAARSARCGACLRRRAGRSGSPARAACRCRTISAYTHGIGANLPGQSERWCGQASQVPACGSHSAGMRKPGRRAVEGVGMRHGVVGKRVSHVAIVRKMTGGVRIRRVSYQDPAERRLPARHVPHDNRGTIHSLRRSESEDSTCGPRSNPTFSPSCPRQMLNGEANGVHAKPSARGDWDARLTDLDGYRS